MSDNKIQEYFLFIDESGTFKETSTNPDEFQSRKKTRSQIVGFLAKRADNISDQAREILEESYRSAGVSIGKKGSKLEFREINEIIPRLIERLNNKQWQPVRLVNKEKITFGSRISIYTNMVAELLLRIYQCKAASPQEKIMIYLVGSEVQLEESDLSDARIGQPQTKNRRIIELESYKQRIEEVLGFSAVHRGFKNSEFNWQLYEISLEDARIEPELQICDLLSNASYDNYTKCSKSNKQLLLESFGIFDQTMQTTNLLERLDRLINENAFSSALAELAKTLTDNDETEYFKTAAKNRLDFILDELVHLGARGRDAHFAVLIARLDQLIGQERLIETGYKIADWIKREIVEKLRFKLAEINQHGTLDWVDFSINRWLLTAANHRGALRQARTASASINRLCPSLARQSEYLPLLVDGLIVQAVHQTDCLEFREAIKNLEQIAELARRQTEGLSGLLQIRPDEIRSDMHAKTLGTLTMSLILAGFENEAKTNYARCQSDEAIAEFARQQDKERQYQYRCHLETLAGDFDAARFYLLKSLYPIDDKKSVSHNELLKEINSLEEEKQFKYFFTLAHWLRLGAVAARCETDAQKMEFDNFYPVFLTSGCLETDFTEDFPAHLILKNIAVIESARDKPETALKMLEKLSKITVISDNFMILPLIQIAAFAETAANLWGTPEGFSLIDAGKSASEKNPQTDITRIIKEMLRPEFEDFPGINEKLQNWQNQIAELNFETNNIEKSRRKLLDIAREIRY